MRIFDLMVDILDEPWFNVTLCRVFKIIKLVWMKFSDERNDDVIEVTALKERKKKNPGKNN